MDPNPNPDMWDVGSLGWTDDNRIKPDVAGPANNVLTTFWYDDPDVDPNYVGYAGTSFSSPAGQGSGAVIADWYEEHPLVEGSPSPAMTRAILTNTATQTYEDLDGDGTIDYIPNKHMGWGRMDLTPLVDHDLPEGGPFMMYDRVTEEMEETYLTTGDEEEYTVAPMDDDEPLKITLAWDDKEAQAGADPTLQNDLRLEVESPGGEIYRGNAFAEDEGAESTSGFSYSDTEVMSDFDMTGDGYDDVNNLLSVYVEDPEPGAYEVTVEGHDIPEYANPNIDEPNQDFALAVQNSFITDDGIFSMDRERYAEEDTVDFTVIDEDMTDQDTVDIEVTSFDEDGYTIDELNVTLRGDRTGIVTGELDIGPDYEDNDDGLYVEHDGDIEATYYDESMEEYKYAFADIDGVPPEPASDVEVDWYDDLVDPADNLITWNLSEDDGDEYFEGYRIYRAEAEDGEEPGEDDWEYLDTVVPGEDEYLDEDAGEYDYTRYWYEVAAVDDVGNEEKTGYPDIEPAAVRVDMPEGSETWIAGEEETIEWYAATGGFDAELTLDYSTDAGESWEPITEEDVDQGEGSYDWTVDEEIEGTNHESMIRAVIEDDEDPTTSELLSRLDQREDTTQSEREVAVIDDELGFGGDWVDILEDELPDEFVVEEIHSDDALENPGAYESYFVHSLDSDNEEDWFEETDGIGTVYTAQNIAVETLDQRSDEIDDPDSVTLDTNLAHWTIDDMHPILEDVAEVGDEIAMHTDDWYDGASFTDTAADVYAEADDGDNAFGVCDDRQDVLTTAIGFDWVEPGMETDYARQIAANSVEYVAEEIELEPPSQVSEIEYWTTTETIKLEWERPGEIPSDGYITHYNVYREDELIAEPEDEMYIDTDVENWEYYEYNVSAVNPEGEGERSPTVTVQPTHPFDTSDEFVLTEYEPPEFDDHSPEEGDTWYMNTTETIDWVIEEGDGELTSLELEYSFDGGETWYFLDEIEDPDEEGEYDWELPNYITDEALISFNCEDEYELEADELSGEFEIIAAEPPENLEVDHLSLEEEKLFYDDLSDGESEDDYETGEDPEGANEWEVRDHGASVGDYSWAFGDEGYEEVDDGGLSWLRSPGIEILDNSTRSELSFSHWRDFDWRYDGGNMRISTNGETWDLIEPEEGYPDTISDEFDNPLAEQPAWTSTESWEEVTFDLDEYIGETVQFEWRAGVDSWDPEGSQGWRIDDIEVKAELPYEGEQRHGDNRLTWDASPDDGAEEDTVIDYNIYRSDTEDELGEQIASIEADGSEEYEYFDRGAGTDDGETWYYSVRAGTKEEWSWIYDPDDPNEGLMDAGTEPVEHEDDWHSLYGHVETDENDVEWRYEMGSAVGYTGPGTWHSAMILDLSDYDGSVITDVAYYDTPLGDQPATNGAQAHIGIDEDGAPAEPFLASSEEYDGEDEGWIELELQEEVVVDEDERYWIVMELEDPGDGHFPQGFVHEYDANPEYPWVPESSFRTGLDDDPYEPASWSDDYGDRGAYGIEARVESPVVQAESQPVTEQEPLAPYPPAYEEPEDGSAVSVQQHETTELSFKAGHGCMETEMDVSFYDAETDEEIGTDTVYANERASVEWDELPSGEYSWYVEISDGDYPLTETFTFEVDNHDPEVDIVQPEDGDIYDDGDVTVAWDGYDEWSGIDHYEVRLRDHIEWTMVPGEYDGVELEDVPDGDHTADVRAIDHARNTETDKVEFTVDTTSPVIDIIRPETGDVFDEHEVLVEWYGYDEVTDIDNYEIRLNEGAWIDVGLSESYTITELESGNNTIDVRATDYAGNQFTDTIEVMVDTLDPIVDITTPYYGEVVEQDWVEVGWSGEDAVSGVDEFEVRLNDRNWVQPDPEPPVDPATGDVTSAGANELNTRGLQDEGEGGELIWEHELHGDRVNSVFEFQDLVYSGSGDDTVMAYDPEDESIEWQHEHHDGSVDSIHVEGGVVYSTANVGTGQDPEGELTAADADDGDELWTVTIEEEDYLHNIHVSGGIIYSASQEGVIRAHDTVDGDLLWDHEEHDRRTNTVHESGGVVFSGDTDDTVLAYNTETEEVIWEHQHHDGRIESVYASLDTVYSGDSEGYVMAADIQEGELEWEHTHHDESLRSIYESEGMLFSGSFDEDGMVVAADAETGEFEWEHFHHESGWVNSVHESKGVLYSAGRDGKVVAVNSGLPEPDPEPDHVHYYTDLPQGEHTVYVRATDYAGNQYTDQVDFFVDVPEPTLDITSPEDGVEELTYDEEFTIEGVTEPDLTIYIEDEQIQNEGGEFEHTTTLEEGQNVFEIELKDEEGEVTEKVAEKEVYALYLPQIPEMQDDISDNQDAIDDLYNITDDLDIDISDLEDELDAEVDRLEIALGENVSALEDAIEENRTDLIDIIEDNIATIEDELEDINDDITTIYAELEAINSEIDNLNAEINDLEAEIDDLETQLEDLQTQVDELESDIEVELDELQGQIDELESEVEELREDLDDLEEDDDEIPGFTLFMLSTVAVILSIVIYYKKHL